MTKRTVEDVQGTARTAGQPTETSTETSVNSVSPDRWPSVGELVGENLRRLRSDRALTQEGAARAVREVGLPWTRKHIAALETAVREDLTIGELVLLSRAFDVALREWFLDPEGREIQLIRGTRVRARGVREAGVRTTGLRFMFDSEREGRLGPPSAGSSQPSAGGVRQPRLSGDVWLVGQVDSLVGSLVRGDEVIYSLAEGKVAVRLGWPHERVRDMAKRLWGSTLDAERDRRVAATGGGGLGGLGARRGHVTRALIEELRDASARVTRFRLQKGSYSNSDEYRADLELVTRLGYLRGRAREGSR
ncbi:MAG TPA: hypothetical protein VNF75_06890 [Candidatus Dormibacteraeota bacterium]|nr:hypothetical protein [Candidatus Dormibacteraeota bacterium]